MQTLPEMQDGAIIILRYDHPLGVALCAKKIGSMSIEHGSTKQLNKS